MVVQFLDLIGLERGDLGLERVGNGGAPFGVECEPGKGEDGERGNDGRGDDCRCSWFDSRTEKGVHGECYLRERRVLEGV